MGLSLALKDRGHDVQFATNEHYQNVVLQHGVPCHPLGTEEDFQRCVSNPDLWHPHKSFKHIVNSFIGTLAEQHSLYLEFAKLPESVGIVNCFGLGAFNVRDQVQLPVLTCHLQPAVIWSDIEPPKLPVLLPKVDATLGLSDGSASVCRSVVLPFLNRWRKELRLPPVAHLMDWWHSPDA